VLSGLNDENKPLKWPIPVTERKGNTIHKMAAYSLITELQSSANLQKSKILELALKYQLPSKYTSFVATASNDTASTDTLKPQKIILKKPPAPKLSPVPTSSMSYFSGQTRGAVMPNTEMSKKKSPAPRDYERAQKSSHRMKSAGSDSKQKSEEASAPRARKKMQNETFGISAPFSSKGRSSAMNYYCDEDALDTDSAMPSKYTPLSSNINFPMLLSLPSLSQAPSSALHSFPTSSAHRTPPPSAPPLSKDWKTAVVSSQLFDGGWDLAGINKILEYQANSAMSQHTHSDVKIWATALAIAILELKCADTKLNWEIVANKGRTWMSKILFGLEKKDKDEILQMVSDLIEQAKKVISTVI